MATTISELGKRLIEEAKRYYTPADEFSPEWFSHYILPDNTFLKIQRSEAGKKLPGGRTFGLPLSHDDVMYLPSMEGVDPRFVIPEFLRHTRGVRLSDVGASKPNSFEFYNIPEGALARRIPEMNVKGVLTELFRHANPPSPILWDQRAFDATDNPRDISSHLRSLLQKYGNDYRRGGMVL